MYKPLKRLVARHSLRLSTAIHLPVWLCLVTIKAMAKKIVIPPLILERIYSMYRQGYTYQTIHEVTGYNPITIANRCKGARLERNKIEIKMSRKPGKYDHLFDESVAEGKFYKDYIKK